MTVAKRSGPKPRPSKELRVIVEPPGKRPGPVPRDPSGPTTHVRTLRLCPADELRLERLASAMGVTHSEAIRRAVQEALDYRLQPR